MFDVDNSPTGGCTTSASYAVNGLMCATRIVVYGG